MVASKSSGSRNTSAGNSVRRSRSFISGRAKNPERIIALELVTAEFVYIAVTLYTGETPSPRIIAALLAVFAILGLLTIFGEKWGRVAYLFGGLVVMAALLNRQVIAVGTALTSKESTPAASTAQTLLTTALT